MDLTMSGIEIRTFFLLIAGLVDIQTLPAMQYPPVWEYKHEYELFEKIYSQTQTIEGLLKRRWREKELRERRCPGPWVSIQGSCYLLPVHWKKNWLGAEETCERLGGHLAILNTVEEDDVVSAYLKNVSENDLHRDSNYIWIGGFDFVREGDWRWVSGERFNYTNWRVKPEDSDVRISRKENCLDWSDGWNDNNCDNRYHFLCEKTDDNA